MNTICYLKESPFVKKFFGLVLTLAGLGIFIFSNFVFGAIFTFIGLNTLATEGAEINFIDKQYRTVKSVLGFRFGTWKPCPAFEYVSVFRTKENQTIRVITAEATLQSEVIVLNLFYDRNKHITFYKTDSISDAFKVADHFKLVFDIDILDATGEESHWL
jgi:hypothetical protein